MRTFKVYSLTNTTFNILQGLRNKPKKTAHVKPDLIDVDLVRGEPWINKCLMQLEIDLEETEFQMDQIYMFIEKKQCEPKRRQELYKREWKHLDTIDQCFSH